LVDRTPEEAREPDVQAAVEAFPVERVSSGGGSDWLLGTTAGREDSIRSDTVRSVSRAFW
jgi:hypothetical protein